MKFTLFISFLLVMTVFSSNAQFAPQSGNSNRYNLQNNYQTPQSKPTAEELEKKRNEQIEKYTNKLKTELNLDELQYIAIKNEIISNNKTIEIILKKEKSEEDKAKEIDYLITKLRTDINQYLNKEQKEKYKILLEKELLKN